ncbi:M56 family metallopeptidase [Stenotrophomonas bentonitica]|uniref:M56 family metallopeptidase n=1 Tax=Stenotrophomonas bentonitica TaxID=1450134 RepID=UPI00345EAD60
MTVHWTEALTTFALQHLWHSALLFSLAAVVVARSRLGAEARSWLLCGAFALAATSPLLVLRSTPVERGSAPPHAATAAPAHTVKVEPGSARPQATHQTALTAPSTRLSALHAIALLWLLGTTWRLLQLLRGAQLANTLHRTARVAPTLNALLGRQLPRNTTIAESDTAPGPMVVGLLSPRILIPTHLTTTLTPTALRDLLLHEAAHINRNDLWIAAAQRAVLAVYWWSPCMRLLSKRLDLAREIACDTRAATQSHSGRTYADSLLTGIATLRSGTHTAPLAVSMSGSRSGLSQRIDNLLRLDTATTGLATRVLWSALIALALGAHIGVTVAATPRLGTAPAQVDGDEAKHSVPPRAEHLLSAAAEGNTAQVQQLVTDGVPVDTTVRGEGTALINAARNGQLGTVDALLALGAQPNLHVGGDGNPLIAAARNGHLPVVQRLVTAGADVNRIVPWDETPLINAARSGDVATVAFLIDHGADVNLGVVADFGKWRSPLNQARNDRVRDYLVQHGAVTRR